TASCPPRQACQNEFVICLLEGGVGIEMCCRTASNCPRAAACHTVVLDPRSSNRRAARHCANTTASDIGDPSVKIAPGASMSAPPSNNASSTATSSLLAAQCKAVSAEPFGELCTGA